MNVRAAIFDLDGTLVQTEVLKAQSYARAAAELRPDAGVERAVLAAYQAMVGMPRDEVASELLDRFGLRPYAEARRGQLGAATALDAFMELRLHVYETMLGDRALLLQQEYPRSTALMRTLRARGLPVGVATMSHIEQARAVLSMLRLENAMDVLVARDDVERPKPDPEIYYVTASRLGVRASECLVLEDSVPGLTAATAAGALCVAVTNPMTRSAVHASGLVDSTRIVDDSAKLEAVVLALLEPPAAASA